MAKRPIYPGHVGSFVRNLAQWATWYENLPRLCCNELPQVQWPMDSRIFRWGVVGSGRFPGPWDAESVDKLPASPASQADQPAITA
mgnify:CR=1|jgi:hypothetical protein